MPKIERSILLAIFFALGGCASTSSVSYVAPNSGAAATLAAHEPDFTDYLWKRNCKVFIGKIDGLPTGDVTGSVTVSPGEHVVDFTLRCRDYRYTHVSKAMNFIGGRSYLLSSTFDDEEVQFLYRILDVSASPPMVLGEYTANSKSETPPFILLLPTPIKR